MHVMRLKEVASKLGVHSNTVGVWIKEHGFPSSFLIGGRPVWDEADIDQWLQQQKEKQHGSRSREGQAETV